MSRLLDKLEQTSKGTAKPLGFRAAAAKPKSPRMVLVAALDDADRSAAEAAREYADAVLLSKAEGAQKLVSSLGDLPWVYSSPRRRRGSWNGSRRTAAIFMYSTRRRHRRHS